MEIPENSIFAGFDLENANSLRSLALALDSRLAGGQSDNSQFTAHLSDSLQSTVGHIIQQMDNNQVLAEPVENLLAAHRAGDAELLTAGKTLRHYAVAGTSSSNTHAKATSCNAWQPREPPGSPNKVMQNSDEVVGQITAEASQNSHSQGNRPNAPNSTRWIHYNPDTISEKPKRKTRVQKAAERKEKAKKARAKKKAEEERKKGEKKLEASETHSQDRLTDFSPVDELPTKSPHKRSRVPLPGHSTTLREQKIRDEALPRKLERKEMIIHGHPKASQEEIKLATPRGNRRHSSSSHPQTSVGMGFQSEPEVNSHMLNGQKEGNLNVTALVKDSDVEGEEGSSEDEEEELSEEDPDQIAPAKKSAIMTTDNKDGKRRKKTRKDMCRPDRKGKKGPKKTRGDTAVDDGNIDMGNAEKGKPDLSKLKIIFDCTRPDPQNPGQTLPGDRVTYDWDENHIPMDWDDQDYIDSLNAWRRQVLERNFSQIRPTRHFWLVSESQIILALMRPMLEARGLVYWKKLANTYNSYSEGLIQHIGEPLLRNGSRRKVGFLEESRPAPWRTAQGIMTQVPKWEGYTQFREKCERVFKENQRMREEKKQLGDELDDQDSGEEEEVVNPNPAIFEAPKPRKQKQKIGPPKKIGRPKGSKTMNRKVPLKDRAEKMESDVSEEERETRPAKRRRLQGSKDDDDVLPANSVWR